MCNSNVRQDQPLIEMLAAIIHNASTMADDLAMIELTRRIGTRLEQQLTEAREHAAKAYDVLGMALSELPKVNW
ncbi:MAG TPA: hypothetical protein VIV12_01495 [Streptosporangiaceae bacterium]